MIEFYIITLSRNLMDDGFDLFMRVSDISMEVVVFQEDSGESKSECIRICII